MVRLTWAGPTAEGTTEPPICSADTVWVEGNAAHMSCTLTIPLSSALEKEALSVDALLSLPLDYLNRSGPALKRMGVFLHAGTYMGEYKGRITTDFALVLAQAGYPVLRVANKTTEALRDEVYVRAFSLLAHCPYLEGRVDRWAALSQGPGARMATQLLDRSPAPLVALVLASYAPTTEEAQFFNTALPTDRPTLAARSNLARAAEHCPVLLLLGERDETSDLGLLAAYLQGMREGRATLLVAEGLDATLKPVKGVKAPAGINYSVAQGVLRFLQGVDGAAGPEGGEGARELGEGVREFGRAEAVGMLQRVLVDRANGRAAAAAAAAAGKKRGRKPSKREGTGEDPFAAEEEEDGADTPTGGKRGRKPNAAPSGIVAAPMMAPALPPLAGPSAVALSAAAAVVATIPPGASGLTLALPQLQQLLQMAHTQPASYAQYLTAYGLTAEQAQALRTQRWFQAQQILALQQTQAPAPQAQVGPMTAAGAAAPAAGAQLNS